MPNHIISQELKQHSRLYFFQLMSIFFTCSGEL